MSRPPIKADKTVAGISVDPITLDRVIPESRRPDGSIRKQIRIRPGFTPQEDVKRFRGTRQSQMDVNALPKGHIIGWAPPPSAKPAASSDSSKGQPMSKSAKKNAKRKEKRDKEKEESHASAIAASLVPDNWDDEDDGSDKGKESTAATPSSSAPSRAPAEPNDGKDTAVDDLAEEVEKLDVK